MFGSLFRRSLLLFVLTKVFHVGCREDSPFWAGFLVISGLGDEKMAATKSNTQFVCMSQNTLSWNQGHVQRLMMRDSTQLSSHPWDAEWNCDKDQWSQAFYRNPRPALIVVIGKTVESLSAVHCPQTRVTLPPCATLYQRCCHHCALSSFMLGMQKVVRSKHNAETVIEELHGSSFLPVFVVWDLVCASEDCLEVSKQQIDC